MCLEASASRNLIFFYKFYLLIVLFIVVVTFVFSSFLTEIVCPCLSYFSFFRFSVFYFFIYFCFYVIFYRAKTETFEQSFFKLY